MTATATATATSPLGHRIVMGADDSISFRYVLRWAAQQAEMSGSSPTAVTARPWPLCVGRDMPLPLAYDSSTDAATSTDGAINDVVGVPPGLTIRPKVVEGQLMPALREASEGADLLVVNSGADRGIPGIVGGRLKAHSLSGAHFPVVLVREDPHAPKNSVRGGPMSAANGRTTEGPPV